MFTANVTYGLLKRSPSRQAQNNAARLSSFLKADGIRQWVEPAVIWANHESPPAVENPMVAVWTLDRLPEELGNVWQNKAIEESTRTRIIEKLTPEGRGGYRVTNGRQDERRKCAETLGVLGEMTAPDEQIIARARALIRVHPVPATDLGDDAHVGGEVGRWRQRAGEGRRGREADADGDRRWW